MPLIYYLFLDLKVFFIAVVAALSSIFLLFANFKDEVLFIFCLPYLKSFSSNTFLLNNLLFMFFLYPLFLQKLLLLVAPYAVLPSFLFILSRNFSRLVVGRLFFFFIFFIFLLSSTFFYFFPRLLKLSLSLTAFFSPLFDHALHFKFDFTINSWLDFLFTVFFLISFFLFFIVFFSFLVGNTGNMFGVRVIRVYSFLFFSLIVVLFVPYDNFIHFFFFFLYFLFTELIFACRFLLIYYGRVA